MSFGRWLDVLHDMEVKVTTHALPRPQNCSADNAAGAWAPYDCLWGFRESLTESWLPN